MKQVLVNSLSLSLVAFLGLTGCAAQQLAISPFDSPGGRLFLQHCTGCHGERAQGGVGPPLDATGHASDHPDSELIRGITQGVRRPGASSEMPAWGGRLSPREVQQLIEFMKSLWTDDQRHVQSVLTGNE